MGATQYTTCEDSSQWQKLFASQCMSKQSTGELLPTSYEHMGATQYRDSPQWQKLFATQCMSKRLTGEPLSTSYDHSLPLCLAQAYSSVDQPANC